MTHHALVLGRGLLGSALEQALHSRGYATWKYREQMAWQDHTQLSRQFSRLLGDFSEHILPDDRWTIAWTAGRSVMISDASIVETDVAVWTLFLHILRQNKRLMAIPSTLFLASSAGAIYASNESAVYTEESPVCPTSVYGRGKVAQEDALRRWVSDIGSADIRTLIGRISTVYGPHQHYGRRQRGLISHFSRCIMMRSPVSIYVPLDTSRDYIYSRDCADYIVCCLEECKRRDDSRSTTKIIASQEPISIAQIIGYFRRIAHVQPRIVTASHLRSTFYRHTLRLRSTQWPSVRPAKWTTVLEGIASVYAATFAAYKQGIFAVPADE